MKTNRTVLCLEKIVKKIVTLWFFQLNTSPIFERIVWKDSDDIFGWGKGKMKIVQIRQKCSVARRFSFLNWVVFIENLVLKSRFIFYRFFTALTHTFPFFLVPFLFSSLLALTYDSFYLLFLFSVLDYKTKFSNGKITKPGNKVN